MDYFARFTEGAKNALACAAEYAKSMGHNYVGTEHLLVGMLQEKGAMAKLLEAQNIHASRRFWRFPRRWRGSCSRTMSARNTCCLR